MQRELEEVVDFELHNILEEVAPLDGEVLDEEDQRSSVYWTRGMKM